MDHFIAVESTGRGDYLWHSPALGWPLSALLPGLPRWHGDMLRLGLPRAAALGARRRWGLPANIPGLRERGRADLVQLLGLLLLPPSPFFAPGRSNPFTPAHFFRGDQRWARCPAEEPLITRLRL